MSFLRRTAHFIVRNLKCPLVTSHYITRNVDWAYLARRFPGTTPELRRRRHEGALEAAALSPQPAFILSTRRELLLIRAVQIQQQHSRAFHYQALHPGVGRKLRFISRFDKALFAAGSKVQGCSPRFLRHMILYTTQSSLMKTMFRRMLQRIEDFPRK